MRIGIYDPYLDDVGGGEKYMLTIAEVLSRDHEVSVFWDREEDLKKAADRFSLNLKQVTLAKNIFTRNTSFVKRYKASKRYEVIVFLSDGSIPVVSSKLFIHFQRPMEHVKPSLLAKLKIKRISSVFCNSKYTKNFIDKTFHINSSVLYPPVDLNPKQVTKQNIILHVGRFRVVDKTVGVKDFKKQYVMLQAFKEMVDNGFKNWTFIMAVSLQDEDKDAFLEMKKNVEGYPVEFKINKSNKELWEFYSMAKIYWHASGYGEDLEKNPEYAEHFGISTVEAMGAGAVPVVINAGGQREIVTDGQDGLLWDTIEELKGCTIKLSESEKLFDKLSQQARVRAQDFNKTSFEKQLKEMVIKA